jgi:tetratricopeptide (TPR) repeat protein
MLDWLRLLSMIFYAPGRGLREVRDRGALAPAGFVALVSHVTFLLVVSWWFLPGLASVHHPLSILRFVFQSVGCLLFVTLIFAPVVIFLVNLFERRGSYRLILQQEYSAVASTILYGWAATSLTIIVVTLIGRFTGVLRAVSETLFQPLTPQQLSQIPPESLRLIAPFMNPQGFAAVSLAMLFALVFGLWSVAALHTVFRISKARALAIVVIGVVIALPAFFVLQPVFSMILASPFLLLMLFFVLRGYVGEISRTQRARTAFKQNLEAATLNPADASAHYNLGLIHQKRGELDAARERFERAIQIDAEEIDAHYQLGRMARQRGDYTEAVKYFEQVVQRDQSHSQYEIWREVGATYLAAGQFEDARGVLERFLEHRESDPEGLYLMGRAHAGLGHRREAASLMEACINAVKTAPAYKYRLDKRWLNEAQTFLRSQV